MELSNLRPADGSKQNKYRKGRGHASGNGKTAGYGHKGQKARSGAPRLGFEGGQMPLFRRLPKRGFKCYNRKDIVAIDITRLEKFEDGATVDIQALKDAGIVKVRKEGTMNYYYFASDNAIQKLIEALIHANSIIQALPDRSGE